MKKIILLTAITVTLVACKSKQEKDLEKITNDTKKALQDRAFKNNATIEFIDYKFIKCDTLNENDLLTSNKADLEQKIISFYKEASNELSFAKLSQRKMASYKDLGWSTLYYSEKEDFDGYMEKASLLKDSAEYYSKKDSLLQVRIETNKHPKKILEASYFVKAKLNGKAGSENVLDTFYFKFDENINLIPL